MYGTGILRGLWVTLTHVAETYIDDLRWLGRRSTQEAFVVRQGPQGRGIYTVEYPEEKLDPPERFRFIPFLVTDDEDPDSYRCTACGICSKVCPPQCIWIVRGQKDEKGKQSPAAVYIDVDLRMNCGFCAEFCPFDSIRMDHDYELASYDRTGAHIYDLKKLGKPLSYWEKIAPTRAEEEWLAREPDAAIKAAKTLLRKNKKVLSAAMQSGAQEKIAAVQAAQAAGSGPAIRSAAEALQRYIQQMEAEIAALK